MSLFLGSGYMQITDTDGDVCLDTRDELFHVITTKTGSQSVANTDMKYQEVLAASHSRSYDLGAVDAGCTDLIGFFKITQGSGDIAQFPDTTWWVAGGTSLLSNMRYRAYLGSAANYMSCMHLLTFEISASKLWLNIEWCHLQGEYLDQDHRSYTVDYKIYCGAFT